MSHEEEDTSWVASLMSHEEEDTCHMRRRILVYPWVASLIK
jgi:hypothetical protein